MTLIIKPSIAMIKLELFNDKVEGFKLIKVYWEGIKLAIKLVDKDAIIIKIKAKFVISKLFKDPIISVGFVNILDRFSGFWFKKPSTPTTINNAKNENIIKFKIKLKLPFFNSVSSFTYLLEENSYDYLVELLEINNVNECFANNKLLEKRKRYLLVYL